MYLKSLVLQVILKKKCVAYALLHNIDRSCFIDSHNEKSYRKIFSKIIKIKKSITVTIHEIQSM